MPGPNEDLGGVQLRDVRPEMKDADAHREQPEEERIRVAQARHEQLMGLHGQVQFNLVSLMFSVARMLPTVGMGDAGEQQRAVAILEQEADDAQRAAYELAQFVRRLVRVRRGEG